MGKLSSKQRKALPKSSFALPGGKYPINDRSHAANAKARATQQVEAGNLSPSQKATVDRKANKVLGVKLGTHKHSAGSNGFQQHSL